MSRPAFRPLLVTEELRLDLDAFARNLLLGLALAFGIPLAWSETAPETPVQASGPESRCPAPAADQMLVITVRRTHAGELVTHCVPIVSRSYARGVPERL